MTRKKTHRHLCNGCGRIIESGSDFDCEVERDHGWALCDACVVLFRDDREDGR